MDVERQSIGQEGVRVTKTGISPSPFQWEQTVPFFSNVTPDAHTTQSWIGSGYQLVQVSPTLEEEWMNLNPVTLISMRTEPLLTTFYDCPEKYFGPDFLTEVGA